MSAPFSLIMRVRRFLGDAANNDVPNYHPNCLTRVTDRLSRLDHRFKKPRLALRSE